MKFKATFTDKELEYIYDNLEVDIDKFRAVEKKIRKQIKKFREADKRYNFKGE